MMQSMLFTLAALLGLAVVSGCTNNGPGKQVFGEMTSFELRDGEKAGATMQMLNERGKPFIRVQTTSRPAETRDSQLLARTIGSISEGDVVMVSFDARLASSARVGQIGLGEIVIESVDEPRKRAVNHGFTCGELWERVNVRFKAEKSFASGGAQVSFRLGFDPQTIELRNLRVVNYGNDVELTDLAYPQLTYEGREANAPWRKEAAERIDKLRKGDLTVEVVDASGKPVTGATVNVEMTRHAFAFGSAVAGEFIMADTEDARIYREKIETMFNRVVMENDLKWPWWADNIERTDKAIAWLRERNIEVRGHCLVWPGWDNLHPAMAELKNNKPALQKAILDHIAEIAGHYKGQLVEWDVLNEPRTNHDVMDLMGDDVMVEWFKAARAADPKPRLYINEYNIFWGGGRSTQSQTHYQKTIRYLIEHGAPLDGIGIQSHIGAHLTPPTRLMEILDEYAKFGKRIEATELDLNIDDEQAQADYLRDFTTVLFSHPSVDGVVMWGFWEGRHWIPRAALYREDWSMKPAAKSWLDLVKGAWWTKVAGASDAAGKYKVRGFLGDYAIKVTANGKTSEAKVKLVKEGATVKVQVK
jgi:endo-1,4-beta-xylanase